jgi:hypothetical protein
VKPGTHALSASIAALVLCIFFVLAGLAFIPHLGVEPDESLFAEAIYPPRGELYSLRIGHSHVPLMLMTYLGTLKSWIYVPIFRAFGTGIVAVRLPMLLAGALSIWLFYFLLRRIAGERAALFGCGLLAVDSMYLLTVCFDWGPVALQHLLLIGGMLCLVRFYQEQDHRALAAGFFLLGLALWDKALAIWMLSGMGLALLAVMPRHILGMITRRRLGIAAAGFVVGALPLLFYNAGHHWVTFRGNFHKDFAGVPGKTRMLVETAAGGGLFGWMTADDALTPQPHAPSDALSSLSFRISSLAGQPHHHLLHYCFLLALLLLPFCRMNAIRAVLFGTLALVLAFFQMAITRDAGGSVHHTILLWPLPQFVVAVAFASASERLGRFGRPVAVAVLAVCLVSGALVINEYYRDERRNGGAQSWTDAVFRLSDYLKTLPAKHVFCMDWGIYDPLRMLNRGTLPLAVGSDQVAKPEMTDDDRRLLAGIVAEPESVFIAHTREFEFFPGWSGKLVAFAAGQGYRREDIAVLGDNYGRSVYEIYRFVK